MKIKWTFVLGAIFIGGAVADFHAGYNGAATTELIIGFGLLVNTFVRFMNEVIN